MDGPLANDHLDRLVSQGLKVSGSRGLKVSGFQGPRVSRSQGFKVSRSQGLKVCHICHMRYPPSDLECLSHQDSKNIAH